MRLLVFRDLLGDRNHLVRVRSEVHFLSAIGRTLVADSAHTDSDLRNRVSGGAYGVELRFEIFQIQSEVQDCRVVGTQRHWAARTSRSLRRHWQSAAQQRSARDSHRRKTGGF